MANDPPTDENGVTYVVIEESRGSFERGELLVCAPLPGVGVREIGYPSRKPLKFNADYQRFGDVADAIDHRESMKLHRRPWVVHMGESDE